MGPYHRFLLYDHESKGVRLYPWSCIYSFAWLGEQPLTDWVTPELLARATMPSVGGLDVLLGRQVGYTWALLGAQHRGQQDFRGFISHICPPSPHQEPDLPASPDTQVRIFFPYDGESITVPWLDAGAHMPTPSPCTNANTTTSPGKRPEIHFQVTSATPDVAPPMQLQRSGWGEVCAMSSAPRGN